MDTMLCKYKATDCVESQLLQQEAPIMIVARLRGVAFTCCAAFTLVLLLLLLLSMTNT